MVGSRLSSKLPPVADQSSRPPTETSRNPGRETLPAGSPAAAEIPLPPYTPSRNGGSWRVPGEGGWDADRRPRSIALRGRKIELTTRLLSVVYRWSARGSQRPFATPQRWATGRPSQTSGRLEVASTCAAGAKA